MRKLSDGKTVRIFVPIPEQLRDEFEATCNGTPMAAVMRDMVEARVKSARKARAPKQMETAK